MEHGVFCRSAARDHPHSKASRKPLTVPKKRLLQSLVVAAVWGFIKTRQMAWIMQAATEERMESSESFSGLSSYVIVMIIMKRYQAFFSHSQSTFPLYTKYQQLRAS